jgi:tetratricopeptide (TPR) repeat protein
MIWNNTKLLLRLYYRPVSAMSGLIDEGNWIYALILVAGLSVLFEAAVTTPIYTTYEAVYRELPKSPDDDKADRPAPNPSRPVPATFGPYSVAPVDPEYAQYAQYAQRPKFVLERKPLPVVGNRGWWFVSFAPGSFLSVVMGIAVLYVPCLILMTAMYGSLGSFSVLLRRDYGPLLTCALMAWAAAHLPFAIAGLALISIMSANTALVLWIASALCFGVLMAFGVRTLFGASYKTGLMTVAVAALAFPVQAKLFSTVSPFLFSPFLIYYAYNMFRGDLGDIGFSLRQRQSFRRSMEAATINPRDASAHYQLGLVFQHRRQYAEAISRFQQAIQIDQDETDAHFQLGRIAREQGRLQEAINYFGVVLSQDEKHARSEIWREVGATYLAANMFAEAKDALETFVKRREYDPEGLYYYGKTLEQLGERQQAQEIFSRCIEAVKTMPHYRYGEQRKWHKLARERLAARSEGTA